MQQGHVWWVALRDLVNGGIVTYCVNEGTITGEDSNIGGIVGDVEDKTSLTIAAIEAR